MKFYPILICVFLVLPIVAGEPVSVSGVYPHLTMKNRENECGTGAVVPWQGDLWAVTYAPHAPEGSSDKLYQISPDLAQHIFEGSVGGTPANRMIHRESQQLLIGPYLIDKQKSIRVLPSSKVYGRLTGNARHLFDPQNKVYYATMEEGLYEVDVNSLEVTCLIRDNHGAAPKTGVPSRLPGYHGKGLYSAQGRLVYTNNGEHGKAAKTDPTTSSGALAQWFGKKEDWQLVRRNQFTEASGPGGITGNSNPDTDPVWTMGWDARSVILGLLENREWHFFRLPKASHSYDGAHGWNTEWPRIREIGESDLLATMHGTFWRFPATFSLGNSRGIAPRSNYLKVIGDFCRWNDRVVFGCDDSAKSEFLNTRPFKAKHAASKQSNSNLWFVEPGTIDTLGPVIGRGSVWLREDLKKGATSDPFLFAGYEYRHMHLVAKSGGKFLLEVDRMGTNQWEALRTVTVPKNGVLSHLFSEDDTGTWIRLKSIDSAGEVTAHFHYRNRDNRNRENDTLFAGVPSVGERENSGLMQSLSFEEMGIVASGKSGKANGYYKLNQKLELVPSPDSAAAAKLVNEVIQPARAFQVDDASVILIEDGKRYRLPGNSAYTETVQVPESRKTLSDYLDQSVTKAAKVTVNSTHGGNHSAHAVDGIILDDEKRWISSPESGPGQIEIDLGEKKKISEIWVVTGWKNDPVYRAQNFDILIHRDGEWQKVREVAGNPDIKMRHQFAEPIEIQKIRVASREQSFFRVYEIAAFSDPLEIQTEPAGLGVARVCREVATERDLLNLHGTFYELPARNAQGLAKVRPIATHNLAIHDFCSHNGLLFFTGIKSGVNSDRIFRSEDGKAAVWAGVVDELWKLGKPRGKGGPWFNTDVKPNQPSDPYLMTAYDKKSVVITSNTAAQFLIEVDIDGTGLWVPYKTFNLSAGQTVTDSFPEGFSAYWVRATSTRAATATVQFIYE